MKKIKHKNGAEISLDKLCYKSLPLAVRLWPSLKITLVVPNYLGADSWAFFNATSFLSYSFI